MDEVTQYTRDVVDGKIVAGELLILPAKRHIEDLKRKDWDYEFDPKYVDGLLLFAQYVPDPDAGVPLPLMDWEIFILGSLVGWRNKKTGGKRYRKAIASIARGQGKTYIASVLATYDFFVQSYKKNNQDIIVASNTVAQSKKLYGYIRGTINKMRNGVFKNLDNDISDTYESITMRSKNNVIQRLSADGGKFDSYHATTAIFDEAGDQKNREAFGKITSGQVKNEEALFLMISTAYQNPNAPLREDIRNVANDIKSGAHELDDFFLAVWSQDSPDEVFKPETWEKSNPLLGLKSQRMKLLNGLVSERNTLMSQGKINDFLVKNMNIWLNAEENAAFSLEDVQNAVVPDFDMHKRQVYIGFDNSMTSDDAALAFVFPYTDKNDKQHLHLYQHSFIPWHKAGSVEAKEKQDGINYRDMEVKGFASISQHQRGLIDNGFVYQWLMDFVEEYELEVLIFAYDSAHGYAFIQAVEEATTWTMLPVRQGTLSLNEPTKWLQDSFIEGRVTRLDDPMMEKSLMNAVITSDNNGIKIDKNKATLKIDLVDALIDALKQGIYHFEDFVTSDQSEFDRMNDDQMNDYFTNGGFGF
ncbi:Phage terminase large subunit [Leuconostoc gelidum subsp. gasicomitatum]|uniref:Phage terminase large subunit n=1 Tax=Leuconostoc gasicomitatum TaxID=115778 RepID=A0ABM9V318_9LACO|nr:terminase TerL endonuclease subunit [Leuconostoc gasicomitatum]CUW10484.1 Phage terminase large subunit [Leuconostoc gasicomitatum]